MMIFYNGALGAVSQIWFYSSGGYWQPYLNISRVFDLTVQAAVCLLQNLGGEMNGTETMGDQAASLLGPLMNVCACYLECTLNLGL